MKGKAFKMSTEEFIAKIIVSMLIVGPGLYVVTYTAHKIFMSRDKFKAFALRQTRFSQKMFKRHEPNIKLIRGVYIFGFILSVVCTLVAILGAYIFWN